MSHDLPKAYDPSAIEEKWAEFWVRERLFDVPTPATTDAATKKFVQLLPPPNVTGRLHMGHMLNQTEMDILTRWHRMKGETAVWVPGTDHAGIATQIMVERQLAGEGLSRRELGREAFVERVWAWKNVYGNAILDQMKRLGASVDWSREYFTMDDRLSVAVREAFVRLYEQGLIYRGAYIVNWDPQLQTAVSDLEVDSEERPGKLYHVHYPLADGARGIVIATTRPETMLGDVAVAVNPADERYRHLVGLHVRVPLTARDGEPDREIPILADEWAKPEFGTGAVKVTPAHDPNDFAIGQRHNLPQLTIFTPTAHVDLPGSPYHGLERFAARTRIVADLEAAGLLEKVEDHTHAVPISQRTGVVIEPRLSMQWFLAVHKTPSNGGGSVAENAIAAVRDGHIQFTPEMYRKTYDEWMSKLHDWCLSRQLWWGHRIPAWHCDAGHITVAREVPASCTTCGSGVLTQETDVLDTWFSSGLLPFTVFGWPGAQGGGKDSPLVPPTSSLFPDLQAFYPTQLLVTGFDILFFWVARMIMLGCHFMLDVPLGDGSPRTLADAVPFREVYIHALVRDADRQKMSKTKGNVIDPIDIIGRFGTDAVRFTLASMASPGTDIAFSEARTEGNRAFANKIWNAARFVLMNIDRAADEGGTDFKWHQGGSDHQAPLVLPGQTPLETRWIFSRLGQTAGEIDRALSIYRFDEAANAIYRFFWGDFCDWYLELVKLRLTPPAHELPDDTADAVREAEILASAISLASLVAVLDDALRLLSPFMPFITEEIWQTLWSQNLLRTSIALAPFPSEAHFPYDESAVSAMESLQQLISAVRALRKDLGVPEKEFASVQIFATKLVASIAVEHADVLAKMARVSSVELAPAPLTGDNARSTAAFDIALVYERQIDVAAERERLARDIAKYEKGLAAANKQLGNEAFTAKAPAAIIEGLRKQAAETQMLYDKARAALDSLPPGVSP